ncbi:hypothetical protein CNMCM8812_001850 [Aspergillus fumigatus]|nr:hypothetical protein CNMCM8714_005589 [Aspergillus fumigatus]KAF4268456.1 hypothetical protein CNMCM8812_001850 [Aspergillus fumigatus]KAH1612055.1 hypothetical protein KXX21_002905 [Aspergillus fumigatus]KAH2885827.1 hypothetical protein KXV75_005918 [Aspergillus fumigatus]KAH2984018.1 hypothetical protein KXW58_009663 [Aspergillus fumigatus]
MKPLTYLALLLGISATTAFAALRPDATPDEVAAAEAECGSLGVMRIDPAELPEGITMSDVRMCANHPLGPGAYPGLGPGAFARSWVEALQVVQHADFFCSRASWFFKTWSGDLRRVVGEAVWE